MSAQPDQSDWYVVTLTPRQLQQAGNDWHISIKCPNGDDLRESAAWKWLARWKARYMVWEHRRGRYEDTRQPESFLISAVSDEERRA